jgi:hypothetical protein
MFRLVRIAGLSSEFRDEISNYVLIKKKQKKKEKNFRVVSAKQPILSPD